LGIFLLLFLIRLRSQLSSEHTIQNFISSYPTFFEDFKEEGLSNWLFYVLYITRRVLIVLLITFVTDGTLQLFISFIMSISVIFSQVCIYTLSTRSFKISFYNLFHFSNEILICIFQLSLLFKLLPENKTSLSTITNLSMNIITVCWFINMGASVTLTIKNLKIKVSKYFRKEKVHLEVKKTYENNFTVQD
jgi:hypothetical protein